MIGFIKLVHVDKDVEGKECLVAIESIDTVEQMSEGEVEKYFNQGFEPQGWDSFLKITLKSGKTFCTALTMEEMEELLDGLNNQ